MEDEEVNTELKHLQKYLFEIDHQIRENHQKIAAEQSTEKENGKLVELRFCFKSLKSIRRMF